jgi:DNA-binding NarL/FixJ family response regulator
MNRIGVLIAGSRRLVRAGYRMLLAVDGRIEVVGEAASGHHAAALAGRTQPEVVLLDLGLPGMEHCDGTARVVSHPFLADAAVMLMTPSISDERVLAGLRAGAAGVLVTSAQPAELREAVRMLSAGQAVLPVDVVDRLIDELPARSVGHHPRTDRLQALTGREREVVALVGKGLTNEEIAKHLVMSPATAKTHVHRAMTKLHAGHRAELVVLAYETGLVRIRTPTTSAGFRLLNVT